jgi:predicted acylesterase/phospholipase RssA
MGPRLSRGLATAAALALLPVATLAQAISLAPKESGAQRDSVVHVAMAISGGASLGSYQSGVTWTLIEFYRRATLDRPYAEAHKLKRYSLASIAGASAGNINAVLSAIAWCGGRPPRRPEESLYWSIWVRVGIDQLLATAADVERDEDRGLFRRAFFRDELYDEIGKELATAGDTPCDVPIGITLTRVYPDSFKVQPKIRVPIQRFASIFRLTRDPARGGLRFAQAHDAVRMARALGVLIAPVAEAPNSIPHDTVLAVVEASSAFPVAFAPRELRYYYADSLRAGGACPSHTNGVCDDYERSQFIDGGVFDNIPMSLTIGMYQRTRPANVQDPLTLVFVDPGLLRGRLENVRAARLSERPAYGLDAVARIARGAVPSARKYEMFSFGRALSLPVNDRRDSVWVRPTSRGYPVVGEHLGSFASFLGRPFREYDFFAGVYDGMYFLATEEFCPASLPAEQRDECLRSRMEEFLAGSHVVVSPASRAVMDALFQEDFGRPPSAASPPMTGTDGERARLLRWLATANASLFEVAPRCHGGGIVDQFFCRSGFDRVLRGFDRDSVRATLRSLRQRCDSLGIARDECSADDAVVALLDHRERYLNRLTDRLMRQAWEVERFQARRHASSDSSTGSKHEAVKAAHFLYRSTTEHHRRGIELDPSTIPDAESWNPWGIFALLPYYMVGGIGNSSTEGGWRPTWYMGRRFALIAPVDVAAFDSPGDRHELFASVGLGIHVRRQSFGLSAMHLSLSSVVASENAHPLGGAFDRRLGAELVGYFLAGKFRLSLRHLAPAVRPALRGRRWMGSIGAADVNGMLYWLVR